MLAAAMPLLNGLVPLARDLRPSTRRLGTIARLGTPELNTLSNVVNRSNSSFVPWLQQRDPETKLLNYEAIGPAVAGVSSALSWGDVNGPLADFEAHIGEGAILSSPCRTAIFTPYTQTPQGAIDCELLSRMLESIFTGSPPPANVPGSMVPASVMKPLLSNVTGGAAAALVKAVTSQLERKR
jgi:hypothetical protein